MMINCITSVTVTTMAVYRPASVFDKAHVFNSSDHLPRIFINQFYMSFAKAQDATRNSPPQRLSRSSAMRKVAVVIVIITDRI